MKISENELRRVIREVIKESGMVASAGPMIRQKQDVVSRGSMPVFPLSGEEISQADVHKLKSMCIGFFDVLINSFRFGFVTREEMNRICDNLEKGCEDNFASVVIVHPCLRWWKNDVSKIASKIPDDSEFKRDFCDSIRSNCEMARSNYQRALGKIREI